MVHRGGYIMVAVLGLMLVVTIMVGGLISTMNAEARIVGGELRDYQDHHDFLGARDVAEYVSQQLLDRVRRTETLLEFSVLNRPMFEITFSGELSMRIYVRDVQGKLHLSPEAMNFGPAQTLLIGALGRLPEGDARPFVRSVGPGAVSLLGAPDEVLEALAGDNATLARQLIEIRDNPELHLEPQMRQYLYQGADDRTRIESILQAITLRPTIWAMIVETAEIDSLGQVQIRWFEMIIEPDQALSQTLAWRELTPEDVAKLGITPRVPDA